MEPGNSLASSRVLSAFEVLVGAGVVIGHNVFRVLPNEVPVLCVLAILSMRWRSGRWRWASLGFRRPESWLRIVVIALVAATLRVVLGEWVIEPLTAHFWRPAVAPAGTEQITGNIRLTLLYLPLVWGFAAFGEEISYRGYLLNRAAQAGGGSTGIYWVAVLITAVLFGYGHYYKGPAGMVDSGIAGVILGAAYLMAGRNLWAPILAHGFIDTFALVMTYLGLDS
jgi:uncharacterized protein